MVADPAKRFVELAYEFEIAVDDAYGIERADVPGAENEIVGDEPTAKPPPVTLMPVPFVKVDVATLWSAPPPTPYKRFPEVNVV